VHHSVLYLFFTTNDQVVQWVSTADGATWSEANTVPDLTVDAVRQIAVVSSGNHMILFATLSDNSVRAVSTTDLRTFRKQELDRLTKHQNLSACAYEDQTGDAKVMLAATLREWGVETFEYRYTPTAGAVLTELRSEAHSEFARDSEFVALAAGSVTNGGNGQRLQLIANGWHGPSWPGAKQQRMKEYDVNGSTWSAAKTLTTGFTQHPLWRHFGAFSYVRPISESELRQEVWYVFNYSNVGTWLYVARWQSDQLVRIGTTKAAVSDTFRSLLAVVEGPPPYVLNGATTVDRSSVLYLGLSKSEAASVTATFQFGVFMTIGKKVGVVDTSFELGRDLIESSQRDTEKERTFEKAIRPIPPKNEITYVYLRPVVKRHDYEMRDWAGTPFTGVKAYAFELDGVDGFSVDYEAAPILGTFPGKPDTHDFKTWLRRLPVTPDYANEVLNTFLTWTESGESSFTFSERVSDLTSVAETVHGEMKAGVDKIFEMGGNQSFSYTVAKKTTTTKTIKVTLDYPRARPGQPNDLVSVTLQIRVWLPKPEKIEQCHWIPEKARGQHPWLVVWSIDKFKTQAERDDHSVERIG
jgi:hypothetical protein